MKLIKNPTPRLAAACCAALVCTSATVASRAADTSSAGGYVSRADYEKLKQETAEMKKMMLQMQGQMSAMSKMQGSILTPVAAGPAKAGQGGAPSAQVQAAITPKLTFLAKYADFNRAETVPVGTVLAPADRRKTWVSLKYKY